MRDDNRPKKFPFNPGYAGLALAAAATVWVIDAVTDMFFFRAYGSLTESLFSPRPHELWMRAVILAVFYGAMYFAARFVFFKKRFNPDYLLKENIIERSINAIVVTSLDGRIEYANEAFLQMFGFSSREELLGRVITSLGEDNTLAEKLFAAVSSGGRWSGTVDTKKRDGTKQQIFISAGFINGPGGKPSAILATILDVTELETVKELALESEKNIAVKNVISNLFLTAEDERVYAEMLAVILRMLDARAGFFGYLKAPEEMEFTVLAGDPMNPAGISEKVMQVPVKAEGGSFWKGVMEKRKSAIENKCGDITPELVRLENCICAPIIYKDTALGVIAAGNKNTDITKADAELLEDIGSYMAAILYMRLQKELEEKKRAGAEKAMLESEEKYRELFNSASDIILLHPYDIKSVNTKFTDVNAAACRELGYSREELLNMAPKDLQNGDEELTLDKQPGEFNVTGMATFERTLKAKNGRAIPFEVRSRIVNIRGKNIIMSILHDLTERKKTEEAMKQALSEKEAMLREVHHRVKNNMQIMIGLLSMEMPEISDEKALVFLKETKNRLRSMAAIHEKLYGRGANGAEEFSAYITDIVDLLLSSYGIRRDDLFVDIKVEHMGLGLEEAMPWGLIVNELVSNSLKHAFAPGRSGALSIEMKQDNGRRVLTVRDNGAGIAVPAAAKAKTVGVELVQALTRQLKGAVVFRTAPGGGLEVEVSAPGKNT